MRIAVIAGLILCSLGEFITVSAAEPLTVSRKDGQIDISGGHFRLVIDKQHGGQITGIELFDGSRWNRLLGGDGQTCPALMIRASGEKYLLDLATDAQMEQPEQSADKICIRTTALPRTQDGRRAPLTVGLTYEIHAEGALFLDVQISLAEGQTTINDLELTFAADRDIVNAPKYREKIYTAVSKLKHTGLPCGRLAFGVNPARSYTNEIHAILEYNVPLAGKTKFSAEKGRFVWSLADGEHTIKAPFTYHNRFSLGLGATATGKPRTNVIGQRVYHWINWMNYKEVPGAAFYPTNEQIDAMADNHATMLIMHQHWMREGGHNGNPHADYIARDEAALKRVVEHAHRRGLRVGVYTRGIERYGIATGFFEKYFQRDWDGLYIDWFGPHCVANHESSFPPETALGDVHLSLNNNYLPAREFFYYLKKLRGLVGQGGFLIAHHGFGNSGVLCNLAADAYLPGELEDDHDMFSDMDNATFKGMLGGGICMPWTVDAPAYITPKGIASMAVWGFYPHATLAFQRPGPTGAHFFQADPHDPSNAYILPYWRVLATVDVERCTVYNSPAINLVAATSSNPNIPCLIYKQAGSDAAEPVYFIITANLGEAPASATITLAPEVLGMNGSYQLYRIDSATGAVKPDGMVEHVVTTSHLAPGEIEGLKLTKVEMHP